MSPPTANEFVETATGPVPLYDCRVSVGGRGWSVLHTGAVVSVEDEVYYLNTLADKLPYGVVLWPAAIALAHEIATRADEFRGRRVLELGAGTGLPGLVAASLGSRVIQTDRHETALAVCRQNGRRNQAHGIEYRLLDWAEWVEQERFDWVIGSDIIYTETLHPLVRRILESGLNSGGRVLIADPFREDGLKLMTELDAAGWRVRFNRWTVGAASHPRAVAVYELWPPGVP